jgi:hypothetical protein
MNEKTIDDVIAIKASAKTARDAGRWSRALSALRHARELLQAAIADTSPSPPGRLHSELADVLGLTGGVQKRWGFSLEGEPRRIHLVASLEAYEEGFRWEVELQQRYASTYNRINRLVGRVLLDPDILEQNTAPFSEIVVELRAAEDVIRAGIGTARQADPWAYCDLGTVQLLLGDARASLGAFHDLDRLHPPQLVYESALDTLTRLSEVAGQQRPSLTQAIEQVRRMAHFRR